MADVFVSYKREDRRTVEDLSQALGDLGLTVWFDYSIEIGEDWAKRIQTELEEAKAIIVCWTPTACKSDWVKHEASVASQRKVMLPIILKHCTPPALYASIHAANLTDWDGSTTDERFLAILAPLERLTGRKRLAKEGLQRAGGRRSDLVNALRAMLVERARSGDAPFTYVEAEAQLRRAAKNLGIDMTGFAQPSLWGAWTKLRIKTDAAESLPCLHLSLTQIAAFPDGGIFRSTSFSMGGRTNSRSACFADILRESVRPPGGAIPDQVTPAPHPASAPAPRRNRPP